jgi:AraC-like DNA-binding protein
MDQRSIASCLSMIGQSGKAIYPDPAQTLAAEAVAYPTVTWYLHAAKCAAQIKEAHDSVDADILKALTNNPFSSVRALSQLTCLSRSTVHRRLTESLGSTARHLHWIRHQLSDDQDQLISRAPASAAKVADSRAARHVDSG